MNGTLTVDPERVLRRMLAAGGEAALHAEVAMHAVALEDAHARIAELEAGEQPAENLSAD